MWPFAMGVGAPLIGVPLGRHLRTGASVCCDPINWFTRAGIIANPSAFVLARPAVGKSTMVATWALGLAAGGTVPFFLGDLKPDYADLTRALGGQVVEASHGGATRINLLDTGAMHAAALTLEAAGYRSAAEQLRADSRGRRLQLVSGMAAIVRNGIPLPGHLETALDAALELLDRRDPQRVPVIGDVIRLIGEGPAEIRSCLLVDDDEEYRDEVRDLHRALLSLSGGIFGETFAHPTSHPIDVNTPALCVDISRLAKQSPAFLAAVLLATWAEGFAAIEAAQTLADHGLRPRRSYFVVLDEMWKVLRASKGMVDRVDALTRLNRTDGVGVAYVTHTFKDLDALADAEDRAKAQGIAERCGLIAVGGVASNDIQRVHDVFALSSSEMSSIRQFSAGAHEQWDAESGRATFAAGRGKMLLKPGAYPGIPVQVRKPSVLDQLHRTDARWDIARSVR